VLGRSSATACLTVVGLLYVGSGRVVRWAFWNNAELVRVSSSRLGAFVQAVVVVVSMVGSQLAVKISQQTVQHIGRWGSKPYKCLAGWVFHQLVQRDPGLAGHSPCGKKPDSEGKPSLCSNHFVAMIQSLEMALRRWALYRALGCLAYRYGKETR
jgi:hypothetical protein